MRQNQQLAEKIIYAIQQDLHSGATELSREMLLYLSRYAASMYAFPPKQCKPNLRSLVAELKTLRPSMAPLQNILSEWLDKLEQLHVKDTSTLIRDVQALCKQLVDDINIRQDQLVGHAVRCLCHAHNIMTISRSSSVLNVFKNLPQRPLNLIVCESRPACEGKKVAAEMASPDISVEYIVDAAMSNHIQQADAVVVGADTILAEGSVVNKCGTSLLGLAAQHYKRPFYVIADSRKCVDFTADALTLEEMPASELAPPESPWVFPHNFYFDVTVAALVDHYITECGMQSTWPWANGGKT